MRDTPKRDLHAEITDKIIAAIESNPGEPQMPWRKSGRPLWLPENALTHNRYNGINVVVLWVAAEMRGFTSPVFATYRQWQELGAQVTKGAKAETVVVYKEYSTRPDPDNPDDDGKRYLARASHVFNVADVDGYAQPDAPEPLGAIERHAAADRFIAATGARFEYGGDRAYYRPSSDHIQMPDENLFCGTATMGRDESWFAVALHELIHWTGPAHRCNRDSEHTRETYAFEELVAEIGSAMLCAELGISQDVRADHAQYVNNWLTILKNDDRAIFFAAAKASQAVTYLKQLSVKEADHG
ncbi:zincin-like metallopeptidase domain-containing protein [uncultured Hyphomicrobium sp.]|jgi:antirestriction protein ArdC|uniref:ArdC family protein n=1 Tax=uncultured Hyphomicrobium sp. TaxID=194373 RepID=UPI00260134E0|nr:zincin-like metallopeptidase domain-containing protein [uncultured Hyphomicrobium sp.]